MVACAQNIDAEWRGRDVQQGLIDRTEAGSMLNGTVEWYLVNRA